MKNLNLAITAGAFYALAGQTALAESISVNAKSGVKTPVYAFSSYIASNCKSLALPRVSLPKSKNGKYSSSKYSFRVRAGKPCAGRYIKGMRVFFTSNRGFRGVERAKIGFNTVQFTDGGGYDYYGVRATINVR